jgi:hypothetical protein
LQEHFLANFCLIIQAVEGWREVGKEVGKEVGREVGREVGWRYGRVEGGREDQRLVGRDV